MPNHNLASPILTKTFHHTVQTLSSLFCFLFRFSPALPYPTCLFPIFQLLFPNPLSYLVIPILPALSYFVLICHTLILVFYLPFLISLKSEIPCPFYSTCPSLCLDLAYRIPSILPALPYFNPLKPSSPYMV